MTEKQKLALDRGRFKRDYLGMMANAYRLSRCKETSLVERTALLQILNNLQQINHFYQKCNIELGLKPKKARKIKNLTTI